MSYLNPIDRERYVHLRNAYVEFIEGSESSDPNYVYSKMFVTQWIGLGGYAVTIGECLEKLLKPGLVHWYLSFGYEFTETPTPTPGFKMFIEGFYSDGTSGTPIYECSADRGSALLTYTRPESYSYEPPVSTFLLHNWSSAWVELMNEHKTPKQLFQLNNTETILKGFMIKSENIIEALRSLTVNDFIVNSEWEIRFCLMNKTLLKTSNQSNISNNNILGIAVGLFPNAGVNQAASAFFNFSAPCPPTCPPN